jgi:hypothetical protein
MAGQEQLLLVGEQGIDVGLRDADASGDIGSPRGEIAVGGEFGECRGEDLVAALGGRTAVARNVARYGWASSAG